MAGTVRSVMRTNDDDGREVLRVIVDYQPYEAPKITVRDVWEQTPVDVIPVSAVRDHSKDGQG